MNTVTIPWIYSDWVIKPLKKIKKKPFRVFITLEYDEKNNKEKDIEDMSLLEYINSDAYKEERWKWYTNYEEFLVDLKKWI